MKHLFGRLISVMLILALVLNTALPVWAENEDNEQGVIFTVELDKTTLPESENAQEVVLTIKASKPISVNNFSVKLELASLTIKAVSNGNGESSTAEMECYIEDTENNVVAGSTESDDVENVTDLVKVTLAVPKELGKGTYKIGAKEIAAMDLNGDFSEASASAYTTLTITEKQAVADGYTAELSTLSTEPTIGDKVDINVEVNHTKDTTFAAGELKLTYDSSMLSFDKDSSRVGTATIKDNNGTLTLEDYGADKPLGTAVYTLAFTTKQTGAANVTLTSAAFVDKTGAEKSDLIPAAIESGTINFSIQKRKYTVTLPEIFTGDTTVTEGEDYTFTAADSQNYTYSDVTATMGGTAATVTDNGNGSYTIGNVTGNVEITGSRIPKTYTVTFTGDGASDVPDKMDSATYGVDYTFTMPEKKGFSYSIEQITINNEPYTGYTSSGSVYTIPGAAITGNIGINIKKEATTAKVTVNGSGVGAAEGYEVSADLNGSYTLTLKPEKGYTYTVTATMGDKEVTLTQDGNKYTIQNVTGDIIFTVTKTVITDDVTVTDYLGVNGNKLWLICKTTKLDDNKVPTYGGTPMFWSDQYNAYCYLVIAQTVELSDVKAKISITDGTPDSIVYNMDVNQTGKVDASDAQLVYNIYNAQYSEFTTDMPMEKFLRADVNGDKTVNVSDAVAIINHLLGKAETTTQVA